MKNISYEFLDEGYVISQKGTKSKELNLIEWNHGSAIYDLRVWDRNGISEFARQGLTLTAMDLFVLRNILNSMNFANKVSILEATDGTQYASTINGAITPFDLQKS